MLRLRQREAELVAELERERSRSGSQFGTSASAPQSSAVPTVAVDLSDYARVEPKYPCSIVSVGVESTFSKPSVEGLAGITDSTLGHMNGRADSPFQTDPQSAIEFILELVGTAFAPSSSVANIYLQSRAPMPCAHQV